MTPLFKHQSEAIDLLLDNDKFALFDEMGTGKTRAVVEAALCMWRSPGLLGSVVIVAPAAVRSVWDDPDDGEIAKWCSVPATVSRYDKKVWYEREWDPNELHWVVTNYEFIRSQPRLAALRKIIRSLPKPIMLVLDESSKIKTKGTLQTKAIREIRPLCDRVVLLNGTPVANNLMDFWAQLDIMDPTSVYHMGYYKFRNEYAKMGGFKAKQVVGYREPQTSEFLKRLTRWCRRVEKKDCLDLPPKLYTHLEVPLSPDNWRMYKEMEEAFVVWAEAVGPGAMPSPSLEALSELRREEPPGEGPVPSPLAVAAHGATKVLRLAQLTSGLLGTEPGRPALRVGTDKIDAFIEWQEDVPGRILVWCRFVMEIDGLLSRITDRPTFAVRGGQTDKQRTVEIRGFKAEEGAILVGQPQAGGWGLNLSEASTVAYLSNDYNLVTRLQSEDRAHRAGQRHPVTYVDFLATSPEGGRTIDHVIERALKKKVDLATWSYAKWANALRKE